MLVTSAIFEVQIPGVLLRRLGPARPGHRAGRVKQGGFSETLACFGRSSVRRRIHVWVGGELGIGGRSERVEIVGASAGDQGKWRGRADH